MRKEPKVSIVTTFHRVLNLNPEQFYKDFSHLTSLYYPDYEIIVVSDAKVDLKFPKTRFLSTGKKLTGPGEKRDFAVPHAKGEIIAFIDDDAYPDRYWLKEAVRNFGDPIVGAVVGPGVTPPDDPYLQRLGGQTLQSEFCSGSTRHRFIPTFRQFLEDHPTYNFLVRKSLFLEIGGFQTTLWCGEDTKLCLSIIRSGKKILYEPAAIVYHHRRRLLIPHLQQIGNIGLHRGYFAKKYPATSREPIYFLPSLFVILFFVSLLLFLLFPIVRLPLVIVGVALFLLYFLTTLSKTDPLSAFIVSFAIILTHISYGINFIRGLMVKNLTR